MISFHNEFPELKGVEDAGSAVGDPGFTIVLLKSRKNTLSVNRPGQDPATLEASIANSNPSYSR